MDSYGLKIAQVQGVEPLFDVFLEASNSNSDPAHLGSVRRGSETKSLPPDACGANDARGPLSMGTQQQPMQGENSQGTQSFCWAVVASEHGE